VKIFCRGIFIAHISFKPKSAIITSASDDINLPSDIMVMDKVTVYGVQEKKENVWSQSQHNVFQKVTECARDALRHFSSNHSESAVKWMIMWLSAYRNLFNVPCKTCKKLLYYDSSKLMFLPPTYRPYDNPTISVDVAYHAGCVPYSNTQQ